MATSLEEAAKQEGTNLRSAREASLHQTESFAAAPSEGRVPLQGITEEVAVRMAIDASAGEELARQEEEQAHAAELQSALEVSRAPLQSVAEEVAVQKAIDASAGEELARRQEEQAHVAELQNALKMSAAEEAARRTDEIKAMLSMSTQRPSDDPEGRQAWTSRPLILTAIQKLTLTIPLMRLRRKLLRRLILL